jgi:hypothetical protein
MRGLDHPTARARLRRMLALGLITQAVLLWALACWHSHQIILF